VRNRDAFREYVTGSLWVLPGISAVLALLAGFILSRIPVGPGSPLAFRGTADDARTLLSNVTSTVVTVIALVLGLAVVALQLSSTQFSPRLLRSFLRDRPTQVVLSTFVATFAYSAAGLYTVGLSAGGRTEEFPRLAVSGALVLLFASLAMVVYFADHLAHSIQIDAIGKLVELDTLAVVNGRLGRVEDVEFTSPDGRCRCSPPRRDMSSPHIPSCCCHWPANTGYTFDLRYGSGTTSCPEPCSRGCGPRPGTNRRPTRSFFSAP
jgi:uncharacterized membrane protein